jgi:hypothetical protein
VPASGVRNSYRYLPEVGTVIVSDEPSPPATPPDTSTEDGIVIVCAVLTTVISKIILPTVFVAGKFTKSKVIEAFVVNV